MNFSKFSIKLLTVVTLFTVSIAAYTVDQNAQRICIVAVHDSSLFTMCPPELRDKLLKYMTEQISSKRNADTWPFGTRRVQYRGTEAAIAVLKDGRLDILPQCFDCDLNSSASMPVQSPFVVPPPFFPFHGKVLERTRPDWTELARATPLVCDSGWKDPWLRKVIENGFSNRKAYAVVSSPEDADVVFLVEGIYYSFRLPDAHLTSNRGGIDNPSGYGDPLLMAAIAVVVDSKTYLRGPADPDALLAAKRWAGAVSLTTQMSVRPSSGRPPLHRSANPEQLVGQFIQNAKWPITLPPLCAAWSMGPPPSENRNQPPVLSAETKANHPGSQAERGKAIEVRTTMVTVPVVVMDSNGKYISGISAQDFHLFEEGIEQKIDRVIPENMPFHAALVRDISRTRDMDFAKMQSAALAFSEVLRPGDNMAVFSLGNQICVDTEFTDDTAKIRQAIVSSKQSKEGTRLYDAVDLAVTERLTKINGRKAILLLTDGMDSGSRLATAETVLRRIEESDVIVYVIGYDVKLPDPRDPQIRANIVDAHAAAVEFVQKLCTSSGGRLLHASTINDLKSAYAEIAGELCNQYTICYYPSDVRDDGSFRRIQVKLDKPSGSKIRARSGYRTSRDGK